MAQSLPICFPSSHQWLIFKVIKRANMETHRHRFIQKILITQIPIPTDFDVSCWLTQQIFMYFYSLADPYSNFWSSTPRPAAPSQSHFKKKKPNRFLYGFAVWTQISSQKFIRHFYSTEINHPGSGWMIFSWPSLIFFLVLHIPKRLWLRCDDSHSHNSA